MDPLGSAAPAFGREARHPLTGPGRVADLVTTIVLLVVEAAVAFVAGFGAIFLAFAFDSCGSAGTRCDEAVGSLVVLGTPVLVGLLVVASIVVAVLRLTRGRTSWPVPVIGIAAVVASFFLAMLLVRSAVPGF